MAQQTRTKSQKQLGDQAKERLVRLLDRRVFNPILRTSPKRYSSEAERKALERIKQKTENEKERVRNYPSAAYLRRQYERKANAGSAAAERAQRTSERLGLPKLSDVHDEFEELCEKMGIGRAQPAKHRPHRPHPHHKKNPEARAEAQRELEQIRREERKKRAAKRRQAKSGTSGRSRSSARSRSRS